MDRRPLSSWTVDGQEVTRAHGHRDRTHLPGPRSDPAAAAQPRGARLRDNPPPIQAGAIPPLLAGPRPARPGADGHRQDRRLRPAAAPAPRPRRARTCRRSCSRRRASWPCRWPRRCARTASTSASTACACCRSTAASRSTSSTRRCSARVHVVIGTPGRVCRPPASAARSIAGRRALLRPRRGGRDAQHGLPRGRRVDPRARARRAADRAVLRDDAAAHPARRGAPPARPRRREDRPRDEDGRGAPSSTACASRGTRRTRRSSACSASRTTRRCSSSSGRSVPPAGWPSTSRPTASARSASTAA